MTDAGTVDVVVVGAGPAGLVAAATLAQYGERVLLVERRTAPLPMPKATLASLRTMELLRSWGLETAVRAGAVDVALRMAVTASLADLARHEVVDVGVPSVEQCAVLSPTTPACVPQDHLESVLLDHVRAQRAVTVRTGAQAVVEHVDGDTVRVRIDDLATGASTRHEASAVVAADGAHTTIRDAIGVGSVATGSLHDSLTFVVRAPLWDLVGADRYLLYAITGPGGPGTFLPAGADDRWVFAREWDPAAERLADYPDHRVRTLVRAAAGAADFPVEVERRGAFSFVAELADTFRAGNVFLVGDAAHRVTPRGGTGMNTAIASAHDLAWKLAWVRRGWADASLLDTYEAERRPLVEHNVARSIDPDGSRRAAADEVPVDLGGRLPHAWLRTPDGSRVSTLDLVDVGLTLVTGPDGRGWDAAVARCRGAIPVTHRSVDAAGALALGIGARGATLVRPDGRPLAVVAQTADPATWLAGALPAVLEARPVPRGAERNRRPGGAVVSVE